MPPLKFRTAGFPQYGFKLEFDSDLRPKTYTLPEAPVSETGSPFGHFWRPPLAERSSPEALGSPAGYGVPPDHSLLWPHPSHSRAPVRLWFFVTRTSLPRVGPRFYLRLSSVVPSPAPRRTGRLLLTVPSPSAGAFTTSAPVRRPRDPAYVGSSGRVTRLPRVRLRYGPTDRLPVTDTGFYIRAFSPRVASLSRRI
jgi:hypothetical protein